MSAFGILFTLMFTQNVLLFYFFGLGRLEVKTKYPLAVLVREGLVLTLACALYSAMVRALYIGILIPLDLVYLRTFMSALTLLILGKLLETILHRVNPGVEVWPLLVNSFLFGVSLLTLHGIYTVGESFLAGASAGIGYLVAVCLLSIMRDQYRREWIPRVLEGAPILFISAGLIAMAFLGIDTALIKRLLG